MILKYSQCCPKKVKINYLVTNTSFRGRFSAISILFTLIAVRVWNYPHKYLSEPPVHMNSKTTIRIPLGCFILFNCGLVHIY